MWPNEAFDLAFLLSVRDGRLAAIEGPLLAEALDDEPALVEFEPEDELLALGLRLDGLERLEPRLDLEHIEDIRLGPGSPECAEGTLSGEGRFDVQLGEVGHELVYLDSDQVWRPTSDTIAARDLVLSLPYDDKRPCREGRVRFRPFMQDDLVLPPGTVVDGAPRVLEGPGEAWRYFEMVSLARISETTAVYATSVRLYVLRRGEIFVDEPRSHIPLAALSNDLAREGWVISGIRSDVARSTPELSRLWVTLRYPSTTPLPTPPRGALLEVVLSDLGLVSVRTATLTPSALEDLDVAEDGTVAVSGRSPTGTALFMIGSVDTGIEHVLEQSGFNLTFDPIVATGDPEVPYIAAIDQHVMAVRRISPSQYQLEHWSQGRVMSLVRGVAVRRVEAGLESWVGTYSSGLFRRSPEGTWDLAVANLPESAAPCAGTNRRCGRLTMENVVLSMTPMPDGRFALGTEACDGLIVLDPDNGCSEIIPVEGQAIGRSRYDRLQKFGTSRWGLLFGGSDSALREVIFEAPRGRRFGGGR